MKVDGMEYKTKWTKVKTYQNGIEVESKTGMSDDVPNMVVKLESKTKFMKTEATTTMELVSVKKP